MRVKIEKKVISATVLKSDFMFSPFGTRGKARLPTKACMAFVGKRHHLHVKTVQVVKKPPQACGGCAFPARIECNLQKTTLFVSNCIKKTKKIIQ